MSLIPGGDGNVEFKWAQFIYNGHYLAEPVYYHPPFKLLLFNLFFRLFGFWSISFVGLILGVLGIYALYRIGAELFDKKVALLSAFLLAMSGLYLSVGEFSINDYVVTVLFLLAFSFYVKSQYKFYALFASLAVVTKETAIFLTLGIVIIELFQKKKQLLPLLMPSIVLCLWLCTLKLTGHIPWNAYNFSPTASRGSMYTIYFNLISLNFLNRFALENWLHLFVFNFNWLFTLFALQTGFFLSKEKQRKEIYAIEVVVLVFCLMVLSFQTWTINRYTLPLLPFIYLFASYSALQLRFKYATVTLLVFVAFLSMSHSVDPISDLFWPKTKIFNESFYLKESFDGGDGVTYNLQYLAVMKQRTTKILNNQCQIPRLISYDKETLRVLNIKTCR